MGSFIESVTELSCHLTYTLKTATLWRFNCSSKRCEKNFPFNCSVTDCMKIYQLIYFLFLCNVQKLHNTALKLELHLVP